MENPETFLGKKILPKVVEQRNRFIKISAVSSPDENKSISTGSHFLIKLPYINKYDKYIHFPFVMILSQDFKRGTNFEKWEKGKMDTDEALVFRQEMVKYTVVLKIDTFKEFGDVFLPLFKNSYIIKEYKSLEIRNLAFEGYKEEAVSFIYNVLNNSVFLPKDIYKFPVDTSFDSKDFQREFNFFRDIYFKFFNDDVVLGISLEKDEELYDNFHFLKVFEEQFDIEWNVINYAIKLIPQDINTLREVIGGEGHDTERMDMSGETAERGFDTPFKKREVHTTENIGTIKLILFSLMLSKNRIDIPPMETPRYIDDELFEKLSNEYSFVKEYLNLVKIIYKGLNKIRVNLVLEGDFHITFEEELREVAKDVDFYNLLDTTYKLLYCIFEENKEDWKALLPPNFYLRVNEKLGTIFYRDKKFDQTIYTYQDNIQNYKVDFGSGMRLNRSVLLWLDKFFAFGKTKVTDIQPIKNMKKNFKMYMKRFFEGVKSIETAYFYDFVNSHDLESRYLDIQTKHMLYKERRNKQLKNDLAQLRNFERKYREKIFTVKIVNYTTMEHITRLGLYLDYKILEKLTIEYGFLVFQNWPFVPIIEAYYIEEFIKKYKLNEKDKVNLELAKDTLVDELNLQNKRFTIASYVTEAIDKDRLHSVLERKNMFSWVNFENDFEVFKYAKTHKNFSTQLHVNEDVERFIKTLLNI